MVCPLFFREWELKAEKNGLFYSIGGKLTSSREDALQIVDAVCKCLGNNSVSKTANTLFPWMPEGNYNSWLKQMTDKALLLGVDNESALWLGRWK